MLERTQRTMLSGARPTAPTLSERALLAGWRTGMSIVNLRGNARDPAFADAILQALNLQVPVQPCTSLWDSVHRLVWVGPDDWFLISPRGQAGPITMQLRKALSGTHSAVTDVSSGYSVLHLSGKPVRDVLAQGCPLDLHPRVFAPGSSAGSHFFKASIWLWQTDEAPTYELIVRSSFMRYFWLMLERSTQECGLVVRRFS